MLFLTISFVFSRVFFLNVNPKPMQGSYASWKPLNFRASIQGFESSWIFGILRVGPRKSLNFDRIEVCGQRIIAEVY